MQFELIPTIGKDGVLITNAAEIIDSVRAQLIPYNYVVDDANYAQAKQDRSTLNKIAAQVSSSRKLLEERVFGTWKADKASIMQIEKEIKAASDALGEGIKAIDDEEKGKKAKDLESIWNTEGGNKYPFMSIIAEHKSWLNKTAKRDVVAVEMKSILHDLKLQEESMERQIRDLGDGEQAYIMEQWYRTRDYRTLIRIAQDIRAKNQEAAARAKPVPEPPKPVQQPAPEPQKVPEQAVQPTSRQETIYRRAFIVEGNETQLRALIACLQQNQIRILSIAKKDIPNILPFGQ